MEIRPKKSLGQNFLTDKNILKSIVEIGNINPNSTILEIGPGTGLLTEYILKKNPKKMFVIEKDFKCIELLKKKFSKKINIINDDVLKTNFGNIANEKLVIFGNLPYNISTQILIRLIIENKIFNSYDKLILMFQKEVADRILSVTNDRNYGRLAVISNWRHNIRKQFNISPNCFYPKPKVESTLLTFVPKKNFFYLKNPKNIEKITRIFFNQKRKMIKNPFKQIFKYPEKIAEDFKLNLNLRPQNLSPSIYYEITKKYENLMS